jgi:hypothetical protein
MGRTRRVRATGRPRRVRVRFAAALLRRADAARARAVFGGRLALALRSGLGLCLGLGLVGAGLAAGREPVGCAPDVVATGPGPTGVALPGGAAVVEPIVVGLVGVVPPAGALITGQS